jgi:hypothetical protein
MISRLSFLWGFGTPPSCVTQTHSRFFEDSVFCFELGFLSEECLFIRCWAVVPRIVFFGSAVPSKLFEAGLWSLELSFSGQQCLQVIRGRALVLRIVFFGLAVPLSYSRPSFGPSNRLFRASSALKLFEAGLRSLELFFTV